MHRLCIGLLLLLGIFAGSALADNVFEERFDTAKSIKGWVFSDPTAWVWRNERLCLVGESTYKPPHRSPLSIALLDGRTYGSFMLEVDLKQTGREYGHRDLCLFFNYRDPAHFYYVHIASAADNNAHNIFIVNGAARKPIAKRTSPGHHWSSRSWHNIKLVRDAVDGRVEVWANGERIMVADDRTFNSGFIGVGSFDDTGCMDNLRITGPATPGRVKFWGRE